MIIDGRRIARGIETKVSARLAEIGEPAAVTFISVGEDKATASFLRIKKSVGERIGVEVSNVALDDGASEENIIAAIKKAVESSITRGVVVQLPLPRTINKDQVLSAIPLEKDIDFLANESLKAFLQGEVSGIPPVAGAVEEIFYEGGVELENKSVGVVGRGKLVGEPVIAYLQTKGIEPSVFDEYTGLGGLSEMDIVISGAGVPGIIQPVHIKDGAVLIDAGTSEQRGELKGDADPACAEKASLFTPVPGGVGPITVVKLFENVLLRIV